MSILFSEGKYFIDGLATVEKCRTVGGFPKHTHDFIELVYILHGKGLHTVDEIDYPMSHGDMLLINYNSTHSFICEGEVEYYNILIKPEMVCSSLSGSENAFAMLELSDYEEFRNIVNRENCLMQFDGGERKQLEMLLCYLMREIEENEAGKSFALRSGLNILLISVFRKMSLAMRTYSDGIDEKLLDYIKKNCSESLTLDRVAARCGYNACYFSRLFKRMTGVTFTDYLCACRIHKAQKLLLQSELTVERIIAECGFSNRTKFFSEFTRRTGYSPRNFRKNKKNS